MISAPQIESTPAPGSDGGTLAILDVSLFADRLCAGPSERPREGCTDRLRIAAAELSNLEEPRDGSQRPGDGTR